MRQATPPYPHDPYECSPEHGTRLIHDPNGDLLSPVKPPKAPSHMSPKIQKKSKKGFQSKKGPLLLGSLNIDLSNIEDHYSLMEHFRRAVKKQWGLKDEEYWYVIQEHMLLECPDKHFWRSALELSLDELPDHFCRRGKKTEYALMIMKNKKGKWQILYADFSGHSLESFSDDKAYDSLLEATKECKKYLTTRNWKR